MGKQQANCTAGYSDIDTAYLAGKGWAEGAHSRLGLEVHAPGRAKHQKLPVPADLPACQGPRKGVLFVFLPLCGLHLCLAHPSISRLEMKVRVLQNPAFMCQRLPGDRQETQNSLFL